MRPATDSLPTLNRERSNTNEQEQFLPNGGEQIENSLEKPLAPTMVTPVVAVSEQTRGDGDGDDGRAYVVYRQRWFVLAVVSLVNFSNNMAWISYATVANYTDEYYGSKTANILSSVFVVVAIVLCVPAMWSVRKFGLRSALLAASYCNGVGAIVRMLSNTAGTPARMYVVVIGHVIAALAYPFIMFLPTKVAASWFDDTQRATASMIMAMSNPLGILFANLIAPRLVVHISGIVYLNVLIAVVPLACVFLSTFGVRSSEPKTPPGRAAEQSEGTLPFTPGLLHCMRSRTFCILLLALGGGMGMFNSLYAMMQQIVCARGYSNEFASWCCISMIISGLVGATVSARIVDRTKRYEETIKISFGLAVVAGICFSLTALREGREPVLVLFCVMFGFFGLAAYPIGLEVGAESTFPAADTTATGLIVLSGQIQGFLYILLLSNLGTPLTGKATELETCSLQKDASAVKASNMAVPLLVFDGIAVLLALIFILKFKPKLRRLIMEKTGKSAVSSKTQQNSLLKKDESSVEMHIIRPSVVTPEDAKPVKA